MLHVAGVAIVELGSFCTFEDADWVSPPDGETSRLPLVRTVRSMLLKVIRKLVPNWDLCPADARLLCRALLAGNSEDDMIPQTGKRCLSHKAAERVLQSLIDRLLVGPPTPLHIYSEYLFLSSVFHHCTGRSVFRTAEGIFGLAPRAAWGTGVVIIALGCDSPLLLRPTGSQFRIVGEAYCDGFMHGEALLGALPKDWKAVFRTLSDTDKAYGAYRNTATDEMQPDDPRLEMVDLPPGWTKHEHELMHLQNLYLNKDINKDLVKKDPRLTSSALRKRGVGVKVFEIV